MFCIAAFVVLSIMGIFSATHRRLAKEAWACVFKRITFRPCTTGFREEMKAKIMVFLLGRSPLAARLWHRYFEVLAWILVVLTLASLFFAARGVAYYYLYGSCQGLNQSGFCVFDPTGEHNKISALSSTECRLKPPSEAALSLASMDLSHFATLKPPQPTNDTVVFIGCYLCDYTRKTYPLIQKLRREYPFNYVFAHFPTKDPDQFLSQLSYCARTTDLNKFWSFNDALFAAPKEQLTDHAAALALAEKSGYATATLKLCLDSPDTAKTVTSLQSEITQTGIYGTPTIFINGRASVGPKPYRVFQRLLRGWRFW